MKCPTCGQEIPGPVGRPKSLDDKEVVRLKRSGKLSNRKIADKLGVSEGAIRKALKRSKL
jgi:DNA-binding CsgD family transcriptional regulator